jgi:putative phosphoribosyl transferase
MMTAMLSGLSETARPASGLHSAVALEHLGTPIPGLLDLPGRPRGMVVFAQGFGGACTDPLAAMLAKGLVAAGLGTLRIELIDEANAIDPCHIYDVDALTDRLDRAVRWLGHRPDTAGLPVGLVGAGTGSAAALLLAARPGARIDAVVCHGGRPDLVGPHFDAVRAPVLLLAGARDRGVITLLREVRKRLAGQSDLILVPSSPHNPGTRQELALTADVIAGWLLPRLGHQVLGTAGQKPPPVPDQRP